MPKIDEQHYFQTAGHVAAAGIGLSSLATVAVACRFQARNLRKQPLKTDDWLLLPALFLTVGVCMCLVYGVYHEAFGHRQYPSSLGSPSSLALDQMSISIKLGWTISLLLPVAMASTKLSLVLLYRRIFPTRSRSLLDWLLRGLAAFIALWAVVFVAATLFCCGTMLFAIWKPVSEMAMCRFFLDVLLAFCVTGFLTDVVIFAIPVTIVWRLQLSTTNKLVAICSFLVGAVTLATSLARLIISVGFVQEAADPRRDFILNTTLYCYWAMVECSVGVVAAYVPTLQPFFRRNTWQSIKRLSNSSSSRLSQDIDCLDTENPQAMLLGDTDQRESKDNSHSSRSLSALASY